MNSNRITAFVGLLFLSINGLFLTKYADGVTPINSYIAGGGYMLVVGLILAAHSKYGNRLTLSLRVEKVLLGAMLAIFTISALFLLHAIDPYQLKVDRWSAIHNFLALMFDGKYPYNAVTHMGQYASPFPVWIALHIPAYLLGNVGYSQILFFIGTVVAIGMLTKNVRVSLLFCSLMMASPAFWYEVAVSSDFMSNMMVAAVAIAYMHTRNIQLGNNPYKVAIAVGLLFSTRLLVAIPLTVFLFADFWQLRANTKRMVTISAVAMGIFVLTFLPFILWDIRHLAFLRHNPFILQTNKMDLWLVIVGVVLAAGASLYAKGLRSINTGIALSLGVMMVIYLIVNSVEDSWNFAVFSNGIDLVYIASALPFAALGLAIYAMDKTKKT